MYPYHFRPKFMGIRRGLIFVAMPFGEQFDRVYFELIEPATKKANEKIKQSKNQQLEAYRTKDDIRTNAGWINILEHLLTAQIVMGVLTSDNPNVFYELGIAHATEPITRQILIANKGYKPRFNIKDLIYYEYNEADLSSCVEPLANRIEDAIKTHDIEKEKIIHQARMQIGPYEFDVMMNQGAKKNFAFKVSQQGKKQYEKIFGEGSADRHIQGVTNLCRSGLLGLNTKSRRLKDGRINVDFSYYWTPLGNEVLFLLKLIKKETLNKRISEMPKYFQP